MDFEALRCPLCDGLLPRQARWRMVKCPYCGGTVTLSDRVVERKDFTASLQKSKDLFIPGADTVVIGGSRYALLDPLGGGDHCEVSLAQRLDFNPERVIIKTARKTIAPGTLETEYRTLCRLQSLDGPGSAYFSQRLVQPVTVGRREDDGREALIVREQPGFWGTLADVLDNYPSGIDPHHAVWIWRRILDVLGYIHENGWVHGDIRPEHLLVHPHDHGILLIGWGKASLAGSDKSLYSRDLMRSALVIRLLLSGERGKGALRSDVPQALGALIDAASTDARWCAARGAHQIDDELKAAARTAFGPPQFIAFDPVPRHR